MYVALHFSNNTKQINFLSNLCKKQKAVENCVKRKSEKAKKAKRSTTSCAKEKQTVMQFIYYCGMLPPYKGQSAKPHRRGKVMLAWKDKYCRAELGVSNCQNYSNCHSTNSME